jgi:hypothetical protein
MLKVSRILSAMDLTGPTVNNDYSGKSVAELQYIVKDAGEAAKAMQGHNPVAEAKYLDQVNDAITELHKRRNPPTGQPRKRSREELEFVIKDAGEALENVRAMGDQEAVAKYEKQIADAQKALGSIR